MSFGGFPKAAFAYFEELAENNEKGWFEDNRERFERDVKEPLSAFLEEAATAYGGTVKLSRPHRDVRFSKDKSPYKLNLFGLLHSQPKTEAPLYASLDANGFVVGTGYHEMGRDQLARFREALLDGRKAAALRKALDAADGKAEVRGRALKTAPKGYAKDHPNIDLIRMKELILVANFSVAQAVRKDVGKRAFAAFEAAAPVNGWLDRHVGPSELEERERAGRR